MIKIAYYKGRKRDNPNTTWLDRLICFATGSPFSHVEVVTNFNPDGLSECWSTSPRDKGVRRKRIDLDSGHWVVYSTGSFRTPPVEEVVAFFESQQGKKYDTLGAIGVRIPFFKQNKNKWFCSEILARVFKFDRPHKWHPGNVFEYFMRYKHKPSIL